MLKCCAYVFGTVLLSYSNLFINRYRLYNTALISVPPEVSIQTASNTIEENTLLVATCDVEPGNPESLISLVWEFEPKYPGTQSQALPGQRENRELSIANTVHSDAGTYRCTAGNMVGSDTGEIQIVVNCRYMICDNYSVNFLISIYQCRKKEMQ